MAVQVPDQVLRWLHNILSTNYHDVNRTYSDVAHVLSVWPDLKPRTETYTYEDGQQKLLLLVAGLIPVDWQGATYRYPIELWVPHEYPRREPMVYIKPTSTMVVRPGQHVSVEGRIYHPFLAHWASQPGRCNLTDLIFVLRDVFAKEPPVRALPTARTGSRATHNPQVSNAAPARPPKPTDAQPSGLSGSSILSPGPALPPKPGHAANGMNYGPDPTQSLSSPTSPRQGRPPPPIPQPQQRPFQNWQQPVPAAGLHSMPPQPPLGPGPRMGSGPTAQASRPLSGPYISQPQPPLQGSQHQAHPGLPAQQRQYANSSQATQPFLYQSRQPRPKQSVPDLMDSPLEVTLPSQNGSAGPIVAPPIPRNPEKEALLQTLSSTLRSQIEQTISQNEGAIPALEAQHVALQRAHHNMQTELYQLEEFEKLLASDEKILRETMQEADRVADSISQREVPSIDEVLVAPTVVGEQLYQLVADERSISDAMFLLARALDRGRVGPDAFVKQTRGLAREQFLKKALIKKIGEGMGLAPD